MPRADKLGGPPPEGIAVLLRYAKQVKDYGDRQLHGERADQIDLGLTSHGVEQFLGHLLDPGAQVLHPPRGEGLADQRAQTRVPRRIAVHHVRGEVVMEPGVSRLVIGDGPAGMTSEHLVHLPAVLTDARIGQQGANVVVPGHHPDPGAMRHHDLAGRPFGPQPGEELERVLHEVLGDPLNGKGRAISHDHPLAPHFALLTK